jgi:hypothetical protein
MRPGIGGGKAMQVVTGIVAVLKHCILAAVLSAVASNA